jgi:hydrogenase nickel incorporation protein HypB
VIEGDVQTDLDALRVARYGVPVVQIVTRGGCHLEARLVQDALTRLELTDLQLMVIENVGNLVCPANYDLGEAKKVVVVNKIDLLPYVDCDLEELHRHALKINPDLKVFAMSAKTGEGMAAWCDWLVEQCTARR